MIDFGTENEIVEKISGKAWEIEVDSHDVLEIMNRLRVSNVILHGEKSKIRVVCDGKPFENAVTATTDFDDVCLYILENCDENCLL